MEKAAKFWDRFANHYASKPVRNLPAYEDTLDRTANHLCRQNRVLEIGCGTGSTALTLSRQVAHVTACDYSGGMLRIARMRAEQQCRSNTDFLQATVHDRRLEPASFDAILAFNLLHLLPDLGATIARVHALLKPGGLFISKTACMAHMNPISKSFFGVIGRTGLIPHVRFLHPHELDDAITSELFQITETRTYAETPPRRFIVAAKV